jgi:beta-galactosidase beta subunit
VVRGVERIGVCPRAACRSTAWDEASDVEKLEGEVDLVTVRAGSFAVFLPAEIRAKCEVIEDLEGDNAKYTKVWDEIKAAQ